MFRVSTISILPALLLGLAVVSFGTVAEDADDTLELLAEADHTLRDFIRDPDLTWFQRNLPQAKGLVIMPSHFKGGFIIGASGGKGIMIARDRSNGEWLGPVFYHMGAISVGLQIGGQASQIILLVMTDKGLDSMLSTKTQLGADAALAAGPIGTGAAAATADVYSFARSKGAFVGVSVEGAVLTTDDQRNTRYYGSPVTATRVLVTRQFAPYKTPAVITTAMAAAAPN